MSENGSRTCGNGMQRSDEGGLNPTVTLGAVAARSPISHIATCIGKSEKLSLYKSHDQLSSNRLMARCTLEGGALVVSAAHIAKEDMRPGLMHLSRNCSNLQYIHTYFKHWTYCALGDVLQETLMDARRIVSLFVRHLESSTRQGMLKAWRAMLHM